MGDKRAFEKFYQTYFDKVYRFVFFRSGGNREQTEDLVSEIFIKALEHFETYDEQKSRGAWVMTIAKNHLINSWRDAKPTSPIPDTLDEDDGANPDAFWLSSAVIAWKKQANEATVYELLAELEPFEADVVTFHYLFGYSYLEIAEDKGMSEGAVKVAAHRAIKKLRSKL